MLASFGLLFVVQNLALIIWGAPVKGYSYLAFPVHVLGAVFSANRIVTLIASVTLGAAFYVFLMSTRTGKAIRAAAQDPDAAELMGVRINRVLALCFGFGAMMAALGGLLLSMTSVMLSPVMGMQYTLIAIIVVVLGGLGNIKGSFVGRLHPGPGGLRRQFFPAGTVDGRLLRDLSAPAPGEAYRTSCEMRHRVSR